MSQIWAFPVAWAPACLYLGPWRFLFSLPLRIFGSRTDFPHARSVWFSVSSPIPASVIRSPRPSSLLGPFRFCAAGGLRCRFSDSILPPVGLVSSRLRLVFSPSYRHQFRFSRSPAQHTRRRFPLAVDLSIGVPVRAVLASPASRLSRWSVKLTLGFLCAAGSYRLTSSFCCLRPESARRARHRDPVLCSSVSTEGFCVHPLLPGSVSTKEAFFVCSARFATD
jgi:hypothetical protein